VFFASFAAVHTSRVDCVEIAGDRPRQRANKNCCRASHELCSNYLF